MKKHGFASDKSPSRRRVHVALVGIGALLTVLGISYGLAPRTLFTGSSNHYLRLSQPLQENSIDRVKPDATINIPFIREGRLYLYQDGDEKLIAQPERDTVDQSQRYDLAFPELSPDQRYVAFLQYDGQVLEYGQSLPSGIVRILDIRTGNIRTTPYKALNFSWNGFSQLETEDYSVWDEVNQWRYVLYDPETNKVVSRLSDEIDNSVSGDHISAFPFHSDNKFIRFKDGTFFLVNRPTGEERPLATESELREFRGWSPDGIYALFRTGKEPPEDVDSGWFRSILAAVNTEDFGEPWKEFVLSSGGGGGEPSVGPQWYFNDGFIAYCSSFLTYLDNREPLRLLSRGGGGCHNENGFVATSPSGQYAFLRVIAAGDSRLELHTKRSETYRKDQVSGPLAGLHGRSKFVWIGDDLMVIYTNPYNAGDGTIYLFDRQQNQIRLLLKNAYLLGF